MNTTGSGSFLKRHWHLFALAAIAVLAFSLDFAAIGKVGYGNAYYAAAIKSMTESFKNFFYVAFDPAGVVSVDKPPLGLWVQTLFVLVFGYHGWAMLLPQALSAAGSCILMYVLTAKYFGRPAGLIAALVFALTPAVVVAARNNTMDMQLVLVLEAAAWFLFKSIESSKWRYLFICAVFVGLGFNIKMLQAYMILPAVVVVYLIFAKGKFLKRLAAGVLSVVIMAAVSLAWVLAVDLTPASQRPYVGSSTDNTVIELIIGHNGMERLYGGMGLRRFNNGDGNGGTGPGHWSGDAVKPDGGNPDGPGTGAFPNQNTGGQFQVKPGAGGSAISGTGTGGTGDAGAGVDGDGGIVNRPDGGPVAGGTGAGGVGAGADGVGAGEIGTAGALRLWSQNLYGQASWLIVLALFCVIAKSRRFRLRELSLRQGVLVFWLVWLVAIALFFSFAGFYHRYYLCMLAPGIAGLCGIGFPELVKAFRDRRGWKQFLLPAALLGTFAVELLFVWRYPALRSWLAPAMIAAAAAALVLMAFHYIKPKKLISALSAGLTLLSLLIAPLYWSMTVVLYVEQNATLPYAGPELASTSVTMGGIANQQPMTAVSAATKALESYLVANYTEGTYLVVAQRANDVAEFIVDTGLPAVAYGGFMGSDDAITLERFKELVAEGKITYFLMTGQSGGNSEIAAYVRQNATVVSPSDYLGSSPSQPGSINTGPAAAATLYKFS
jgi:4-amino-4-deoxy-L-arabinose transferase-like glycosyltransferase